MFRKDIIKEIKQELYDDFDYDYLVIDMRKGKPNLFYHWR